MIHPNHKTLIAPPQAVMTKKKKLGLVGITFSS